MNTATVQTSKLPLLPVKGMVLFINIEHPVVVGRPRSLAAIEEALKAEDKSIIVVTQRNSAATEQTSAGAQALHREAQQINIIVAELGRIFGQRE